MTDVKSGSCGIRMRDVAARAGVSTITVSRALSNPETVHPATRAKVATAIAEIGYVPDRVAGGLKSRRTRTIACVIPGLAVPVFAEFLDGLTETFARNGYQVLLASSGYSEAGELAAVRGLFSHRPDGLVLTGVSHGAATVALIRGSGIPVVEVWDWTERPIDMLVGFSNFEAIRTMVGQLAERGRRSIGLLATEDAANGRAQARQRGYETALAGFGLPTLVARVAPTIAGGRDGLAQLLQADPGLDCAVTVNDLMAVGVMAEARSRGIAVPGRLAVTGFADFEIARHWLPSLTTIRVPRHAMGRLAAERLWERLVGGPARDTREDVGFEIIWRESA